MKKGHGRIALILDRSGSMETVRQATVDGYNEFINGQKLAPGTADVLLAQFDDEYEIVYDQPLSAVPVMTPEQFVPRGNTALYDAIGRTIQQIGADLAALDEADRPDSVTIVILTDGLNNASQEYSAPQIATMIRHQADTYNWKFVFLGANQDAVLTASKFNIPRGQTMSYAASATGMANTMGALNRYTVSNRMAGATGQMVQDFTDEDRVKSMYPDDKPAESKKTKKKVTN